MSEPLKLSYTGSVKNVWKSEQDLSHLWFEFTDDYSVFDWGKMPDQICNKGKSLALIGAYLFELLSDREIWKGLPSSKHLRKFDASFRKRIFESKTFIGADGISTHGLPSHFVTLADNHLRPIELATDSQEEGSNSSLQKILSKTLKSKEALFMQVLAAQVTYPTHGIVANQSIYFYAPRERKAIDSELSRHLIPLEVLFRFGMSEGSSLLARLNSNPDYARLLGLHTVPQLNSWFPQPVIEFSTKLEPKDRLLTLQEAVHLSGLSKTQFTYLTDAALLAALALHHAFAERGLELWDGKFEFLLEFEKHGGWRILLADSIGPDELRILHDGQQLSKEFIRQYYRSTPWAMAVEAAKIEAGQRLDWDWKEICLNSKNGTSPKLPENIKSMADQLYGVLANTILGTEILPDQPSLSQFVASLRKAALPAPALHGRRKA